MDDHEKQPKKLTRQISKTDEIPHFAKTEIEHSLPTLPCHFNWNLHSDVTQLHDVFQQEEEANEHIEDIPKDKNLYYLLLSYLFTIGNFHNPRKSIDYNKAESYCNDIIVRGDLDPNEKEYVSRAELLVAKCNLLHIWHKRGKIHLLESQQLFDEIKELRKSLNFKDKADLGFLEAHALNNASEEDNRKRVLEKYEQILKIYSYKYVKLEQMLKLYGNKFRSVLRRLRCVRKIASTAMLEAATALGKLRRSSDDFRSPSRKEMRYIETCMVYRPHDPYPFVLYAQSNSHRLFDDDTKVSATSEIEKSLQRALGNAELYGGVGIVSKYCAKVYRKLFQAWNETTDSNLYFEKYENTLSRAIDIRPKNFGLAHELAIYFIRVAGTKTPQEHEIEFVKLLLSERSSRYRFGNIWADMDLARFLYKYDKKNFDIVEFYSKCISIYPPEKERGEFFYELGWVYNKQSEHRKAIECLMQTLRRSKSEKMLSQTNELLRTVAATFLETGKEVEDRYLVATCYLQLDEIDKAYGILRDILDNFEHSPRYQKVERYVRHRIIKILLVKRKYQEAIAEIQKLDDSEEKKQLFAETYLGKASLAKSGECLNTISLQNKPEHVEWFYTSAWCGSSEGALEYLKSLTTLTNHVFESWSLQEPALTDNAFCIPLHFYEDMCRINIRLDKDQLLELFSVGSGDLQNLRLSRFKMVRSRSEHSVNGYKKNISDTIIEAAFTLDRCFTSFIKAFYAATGTDQDVKPYYPYPKMQPTRKKKKIKEAIQYVKSQEFQGCVNGEECDKAKRDLFTKIRNEQSSQSASESYYIEDTIKDEIFEQEEQKIIEYFSVAERMKEIEEFEINLADAKDQVNSILKDRRVQIPQRAENQDDRSVSMWKTFSSCVDYIARHCEMCNARDFGFISDVLRKTNDHKHGEIITQNVDGQRLKQLEILAHKAAEFSEKTLLVIQCFKKELPANQRTVIKEKISDNDWEGAQELIESLTIDEKKEEYYNGGLKLREYFSQNTDQVEKYKEKYTSGSHPTYIEWFYRSGLLGKEEAAKECINGLNTMYSTLFNEGQHENLNFVHGELIKDLKQNLGNQANKRLKKQLKDTIWESEKSIIKIHKTPQNC